MVGAIGFAIFEKPGVPGVTGDLSDDCEDMEPMSARLEEFLREPSEVVEPDVFLREKRPMVARQRRGSDLSRNDGRAYRVCVTRARARPPVKLAGRAVWSDPDWRTAADTMGRDRSPCDSAVVDLTLVEMFGGLGSCGKEFGGDGMG